MPTACHGDVNIHWLRAGDPDGEPVVLIMGLSGSHRDWHRHVPHLLDRDVLLIDNRGTGLSSPVGGPLSMADMVEDIVAVLDAGEVESAHVHGTSMGGMIAQHLALTHRDRVRSLILSATTPGGVLGQPPWRLLLATALRPIVGSRRTMGIVAPMLYSEHTRNAAPERVKADLRIRLENATGPKTTLAQMAAIARHDTRERLDDLGGMPVTVIHGDKDVLVPPSHGQALADGVPGSELVVLEGAAHVLATDNEHGLAAAVHGHFDRCRLYEESAV
jgi:pimeloyl-ACP methyl ester carboxylesterase